MNLNARYWTLHWVLWPFPILTLLKARRAVVSAVRRWAVGD